MEKIYQRHIYDIELKSLLSTYAEKIKAVNLSSQDPLYFYNLIEHSILEYCHSRNINFDEIQIVVTPADIEPYKNYLALSLIFCEEFAIRQFLNYHQTISDTYQPSLDFVGIVEFQVVKTVYWSSPFDNSNRLEQIMNWVEVKRYPDTISNITIEKVIQKRKPTPNTPNDSLIWGNELTLLAISNELFNNEYTTSKHMFHNAVRRYEKIEWLGDVDAWIYLMFALTHPPYEALTTSKGVRKYFHVAKNFFDFPNAKSKISKNYDFAKRSSSINAKKAANHQKIRSDIDSILKNCFKKK